MVAEKNCFQIVLHPHENAKLSFSNCSGLKSVFEKLRFRDGLVGTVRLTGEIKLRFLIFIFHWRSADKALLDIQDLKNGYCLVLVNR